LDFIDKNEDNPFFLYIPTSMPHVPLFASEHFEGVSERGLYGDVIEEIDWNVGRLINYLEVKDLENNTFIIYTSDNGPWLSFGKAGGSADPLRGGKFTNYEGGVREPAVMYWPGTIPPNSRSDQIVSSMDLFPTIAHYAGASLPENVSFDGFNIAHHLENPHQNVERNTLYYNLKRDIAGIRVGDWKYIRKNKVDRRGWIDIANGQLLFNLGEDMTESKNLAEEHPEKVRELEQKIQEFEATLED